MTTENVLVSWSGGKDSALAVHRIQQSGQYSVAALITTVTEAYDRVSIHGIRRSLLRQQARSIGFPLHEVVIPPDATNEIYESKMRAALEDYAALGIRQMVFGDIFLEDVRKYRENLLAPIEMGGLYSLWGEDTSELAQEFIRLGFRTKIAVVDSQSLDASFVGVAYDSAFLERLPPAVDPCGERGEFHTFVYDGPVFSSPIQHTNGGVVFREGRFFFCDFVPVLEGGVEQ